MSRMHRLLQLGQLQNMTDGLRTLPLLAHCTDRLVFLFQKAQTVVRLAGRKLTIQRNLHHCPRALELTRRGGRVARMGRPFFVYGGTAIRKPPNI